MSAEINGDLFPAESTDEWLMLRLPWPPSVNDFKVPHPKVRGLYFLTSRAKTFRETVQWTCANAGRFGDAELELRIDLHPPDRRKRDADNFIKAIFDSLMAANVFDDDSQVQEYSVRKRPVVKDGAAIVYIRRFCAGSVT